VAVPEEVAARALRDTAKPSSSWRLRDSNTRVRRRSDRVGRKRVIGSGHAFFAVSMAVFASAGFFGSLAAERVLFTPGSVFVFQTGTAGG